MDEQERTKMVSFIWDSGCRYGAVRVINGLYLAKVGKRYDDLNDDELKELYRQVSERVEKE